MDIRDAAADDLPGIVALYADDRLGAQRELPTDPLPGEYWAAFAAIERDPNHRLVVLEDRDELVGTLQLTLLPHLTFRGGWRAQIEAVRTASHRRGEGLGRLLLTWAIEQARQASCHVVQLTTNVERGETAGFYRSLGFTPTHVGMKLYLEGTVGGR